MANAYDIAYGAGLIIGSPVWLLRRKSRAKVMTALRERMGHVAPREGDELAVMIHAVSLGEMNATRALVQKLREARPGVRFIISTTTTTGFEQAKKLYGAAEDVKLIRYPLDFSSAIRRVLEGLRPSVVVLMELEVWPNFMKHCSARQIPVIVINARLTTSSFANYQRGLVVLKRMFRQLTRVCAQDETYGGRFKALGVPEDRITVTGTMKFDNAAVEDRVAGDEQLASEMGIKRESERVWVCGSTGPGEEEMVLGVYRRLVAKSVNLRLVIVPRHPERFDEVAQLIKTRGFRSMRRSKPQMLEGNRVILGDTMGELRKWYSLADVVFVGRTLVDLGPRQHGSDMIEPAALGKPVIVGPWTGNFAEVMNQFREGNAIIEVKSEQELERAVERVLADDAELRGMGQRAQEIVRANQGATDRHVGVILELLGARQ
ncbi:MAG TPA: 3-deoxy-D-manno-octulosonic acid transferase [Tepidisphaeraceae bacterium]|jgi:3-deoxy-D-manno-octulosonic-acid transferase